MNQKSLTTAPWMQATDEQLTIKPVTPEYDVHVAMKMAGAKDVPEKKEARTRRLCCCRHPGCGIGPFTEYRNE